MNKRDPGAQPERTRLAWRRTVLAATVVGAVTLRYVAVHDAHVMGAALLATLALVWLALAVMMQRRIKQLAAAKPSPVPVMQPLALTAGLLLFVGISALSIVLS